jgi:hypothetical protein
MRVFCLSPQEMETCWQDFAVILQRFERDCQNLTADQVVTAVRNSTGHLWGLQDEHCVHGIVFTEIQQTARGLVCVLVGAYGEGSEEDKRAVLAAIEDWARDLHCISMRIIGRKGWRRWDRRFRKTAEVLECPL